MCIRDRFCTEQGVSPALEWDGQDDHAFHLLLYEGDAALGTARVFRLGPHAYKVGRVAVRQSARRRGAGRAIMEYAHRILAELSGAEMPTILLHAQTAVAEFYAKLGYITEGAEFVEADIPHVAMRRGAPTDAHDNWAMPLHEFRECL